MDKLYLCNVKELQPLQLLKGVSVDTVPGYHKYIWDVFSRSLGSVTQQCHTLSAVLSEGVCKRQWGNAQWDSGKMAERMGALEFPVFQGSSPALGISAHAGGLLCAPIAQQVVCNELWLFVCLEGNSGLDGGQSQDNSHLILGVALWAMEGGKTLHYREHEGLEVMSLLEVHIFSFPD